MVYGKTLPFEKAEANGSKKVARESQPSIFGA
jgi:hypothetical protein